jgi:guanine nucleotide exchange factor
MDGVLSSETTLTSESMSTHVPGARTVLIHGVCVSDDVRRRGIATALIAEYQRRLAGGPYERALLIAHKDKVAFYERIGFKSRGLSVISFAGVPWVELEWAVPVDKSQGVPQTTSRDLFEALQSQSASPRREGQLLSSFPNGILDLTEKGDTTTNRYDLLCVNERCGSIILRRGVAVLQEHECIEVSALSSIGWGKVSPLAQMEPPGSGHPDLPGLPTPPEKIHWWLVTPSPLLFENIGFSKPVHSGLRALRFITHVFITLWHRQTSETPRVRRM